LIHSRNRRRIDEQILSDTGLSRRDVIPTIGAKIETRFSSPLKTFASRKSGPSETEPWSVSSGRQELVIAEPEKEHLKFVRIQNGRLNGRLRSASVFPALGARKFITNRLWRRTHSYGRRAFNVVVAQSIS
jgi:hypothetical protein